MTAAEIYARFRALPGSEQIASEFAIAGLQRWLAWADLAGHGLSILEVGAGIGTLSFTIHNSAHWALLTMLEDDEWCRHALYANTGLTAGPLRASRRAGGPWDFVVIDGGDSCDDYYADLAPRAVVFFEGRRREQRHVLEAMSNPELVCELRGGRPYCWAEWKPADRSKGFVVYQFEPTPAERVAFAAIRMREGARDLLVRLGGKPIGKKRKGGELDGEEKGRQATDAEAGQAGLLTDLPSGQPRRYTDARGCSPSASGLSPEDAIRRVRDRWPRGDG